MNPAKNLLDLPSELVGKCLSNLPYDQISAARMVCRTIDYDCKMLLNSGLISACKIHETLFNSINSELPRLGIRDHFLWPHMRIMEEVFDDVIAPLDYTFEKYIERNVCCFIPGKVLDYIMKVIRVVKGHMPGNNKEDKLAFPRQCRPLQKLIRLSTKAIDHFDKNIKPNLPKIPRLSRPSPLNPADVLTPGSSPEFDFTSLRTLITIKEQELIVVKKSLETEKISDRRFKNDFMKFSGDAQKISEALSRLSVQYLNVSKEILDLGTKRNGENKRKKMKRRTNEETEETRVLHPRKAKKSL